MSDRNPCTDEHKNKTTLEALRHHLDEGTQQARNGEFVDQSKDEMLIEFKARAM